MRRVHSRLPVYRPFLLTQLELPAPPPCLPGQRHQGPGGPAKSTRLLLPPPPFQTRPAATSSLLHAYAAPHPPRQPASQSGCKDAEQLEVFLPRPVRKLCVGDGKRSRDGICKIMCGVCKRVPLPFHPLPRAQPACVVSCAAPTWPRPSLASSRNGRISANARRAPPHAWVWVCQLPGRVRQTVGARLRGDDSGHARRLKRTLRCARSASALVAQVAWVAGGSKERVSRARGMGGSNGAGQVPHSGATRCRRMVAHSWAASARKGRAGRKEPRRSKGPRWRKRSGVAWRQSARG